MIKKINVLAAALRLEEFTVSQLTGESGVPEATVRTVLDRSRGWFTAETPAAAIRKRGGQEKVFRLTDEGRHAIVASLGSIPKVVDPASLQDFPAEAPLGLQAARNIAAKLAGEPKPKVRAALQVSGLRNVDWALKELEDRKLHGGDSLHYAAELAMLRASFLADAKARTAPDVDVVVVFDAKSERIANHAMAVLKGAVCRPPAIENVHVYECKVPIFQQHVSTWLSNPGDSSPFVVLCLKEQAALEIVRGEVERLRSRQILATPMLLSADQRIASRVATGWAGMSGNSFLASDEQLWVPAICGAITGYSGAPFVGATHAPWAQVAQDFAARRMR